MQPYGGFWIRVAAYIIDWIVTYIASFVVTLPLGLSMAMLSPDMVESGMASASGGVVGLIVGWLYYAVLESSPWQGTVGKKALNLVVTDMEGNRISFGRATGRYFAKILSGLILLIGFFMIGWTQRKQGLHDMLAGTLVWKARAPELVRTDASIFE